MILNSLLRMCKATPLLQMQTIEKLGEQVENNRLPKKKNIKTKNET